MQTLRRWRTDIRRRRLMGGPYIGRPRGGADRPWSMLGGPLLLVDAFSCLLKSSWLGVGLEFDFYFGIIHIFSLFHDNPRRNTDSPKLWNSVSINHNSMLEVDLCPFSCLIDSSKWTITTINSGAYILAQKKSNGEGWVARLHHTDGWMVHFTLFRSSRDLIDVWCIEDRDKHRGFLLFLFNSLSHTRLDKMWMW
jgi:hypothetical protein